MLRPVTQRELHQIIWDEGGASVDDVMGRSRLRSISAVRHRVWLRLHDDRGLSYPEIGRMFGRDHTTVMVACQKLRRRGA